MRSKDVIIAGEPYLLEVDEQYNTISLTDKNANERQYTFITVAGDDVKNLDSFRDIKIVDGDDLSFAQRNQICYNVLELFDDQCETDFLGR